MSISRRLDLLLLEKGLASTRAKARELILQGKVSVNGRTATRPGEKLSPTSLLALSGPEHPYVSRGGLKLEAALRTFGLDVRGRRVLDVGQSTGGFTHCLLLEGAAAVVGVDVGSGQLAASLRSDPRVTCWEKTDIRAFSVEQAGTPFELFVADLSFVSLTHVIPVLPALLEVGAEGIVLVKPQFEVGRERVGSGGIVRDAAARESAVDGVRAACEARGFTVTGVLPSPLPGGDGNQEFLLHLVRRTEEGT